MTGAETIAPLLDDELLELDEELDELDLDEEELLLEEELLDDEVLLSLPQAVSNRQSKSGKPILVSRVTIIVEILGVAYRSSSAAKIPSGEMNESFEVSGD